VTQLSVKARDAWWTVLVVDPIAAPLLRVIATLRAITPNRITVASVAVAICSAIEWVRSDAITAAILFQLAFLLDCMDGKLAHLRHSDSAYGAWLDAASDAVRMTVCYAGFAWWVAGRSDLTRSTVLALAAYPVLHAGVILTGRAWPSERPAVPPLELPASTLAMLRAAPSRLAAPGSTVDAEAAVFTLGPVLAIPVIGLWIATAFNLIHLGVALAARGARVAAAERRPE
jgi:phosphatidylglycerophosphate synthase